MINEPYKVSILVPIYGVEKYIEKCARSLFEQTYHNLEFIFVDDFTPDNSIVVLQKVLEDYPDRKGQIKIIRHEKNMGLSGARHTAVDNSTGDFIVHVDSDDWVERDLVQKLVAKQSETNADIVSGDAITEGEPNKTLFNVPIISDPHKMILSFLSSDECHEIWGRLIQRNLYSKIPGPTIGIDIGEDTQAMCQLFYYAKKLANVKEPLYHYYIANTGSLTNSKAKKINEKFEIQLIQSSIIVRDFFKGKDKQLEYKANWFAAYRMWGSLWACAPRYKKLFYQILSYKKNIEGNPFPSAAIRLGKLKPFVRLNYYTLSLLKVLAKIFKITI